MLYNHLYIYIVTKHLACFKRPEFPDLKMSQLWPTRMSIGNKFHNSGTATEKEQISQKFKSSMLPTSVSRRRAKFLTGL